MGRRRNESLMDILVVLPWWVGIGVGIVGFVGIRWGIGAWLSHNGGQLGKAVGGQLSNGTLTPFAWFFLALCCIAAFFSWLRTRQRAELLDGQRSLDTIRAMSWRGLEQLVGEAYRRQGYQITETGQGGADGGVDVVLRRDGRTTLVQCKHWRSQRVSVSVVREMYGLLAHHGADAVKIVCTGVFTADAVDFARGKPIELIDGAALLELVRQVQAGPPVNTVSGLPPTAVSPVRVEPTADPRCPRCGSAMARRTNRTTGSPFWGCVAYPRCKGTAPA
jgi:restriction system protein